MLHFAASYPEISPTLVLFGPIQQLPQTGRKSMFTRAAGGRSKGKAGVADTVVSNALASETPESRPKLAGFVRELLCGQDAEGYAMTWDALAAAEDPDWSAVKAKVTIVSGKEDKISVPATCAGIRGHWVEKACISLVRIASATGVLWRTRLEQAGLSGRRSTGCYENREGVLSPDPVVRVHIIAEWNL
jgi:hypothetical protein